MLQTSARLLRLLSLLQSRREWTGTELAARLDVTTRTVRNDVGRLRNLGYPVPPGGRGLTSLARAHSGHLPPIPPNLISNRGKQDDGLRPIAVWEQLDDDERAWRRVRATPYGGCVLGAYQDPRPPGFSG